MTRDEKMDVMRRYGARFGNAKDLAHPSILGDERLVELMRVALERGSEVTEAEVEGVFGKLPWDW
jgi:hypothetical protein